MTTFTFHRFTSLDLRYEPWPWPFATGRRAEIDAHFAERTRQRPAIWNGRVLLGRHPEFGEGHFTARYFDTDFASFLAWRDWGFADADVFNGFGMGALRASDGAFVLGEMGQHTANAGRIYFPAGTPDLDDIKGETVDLAGSVVRELEEETGLVPSDYRASPSWDCVIGAGMIAMMRLIEVDCPGEELRHRIEGNIAAQSRPELARVHVVRSTRDFTPQMSPFVTAFLVRQFEAAAG